MKTSRLIGRYRRPFIFTLLLVLLDAGLLVLFPLFIGRAIDGAMTENYQGAIHLGFLGLATLLIGALRRFFDSRFYARVYEQLGARIGDQEDSSVSTKSAHLGFLTEVVEFFENTLPELINNSIGLVGTLVILATLNPSVFVGCLLVSLVIMIIYGFSAKGIDALNQGYNEELERQVSVISEYQPIFLRNHLKKLMRWNIRLSDRETLNFSIIWLFMMSFLVLSIVFSIRQGITEVGVVFSLVLYLFQFIESAAVMPVFYQEWLRFRGIIGRLAAI